MCKKTTAEGHPVGLTNTRHREDLQNWWLNNRFDRLSSDCVSDRVCSYSLTHRPRESRGVFSRSVATRKRFKPDTNTVRASSRYDFHFKRSKVNTAGQWERESMSMFEFLSVTRTGRPCAMRDVSHSNFQWRTSLVNQFIHLFIHWTSKCQPGPDMLR